MTDIKLPTVQDTINDWQAELNAARDQPSNLDLLRWEFPRYRQASTTWSTVPRYILDAWIAEDGTERLSLFDPVARSSSIRQPEGVALLPQVFIPNAGAWETLTE